LDQLFEIYEYWERTAGVQRANAWADAVAVKTQRLTRFPEMGAIDFQKSNEAITIRYLLEGHHKIFYSYEREDRMVKIRAIKGTRQNP
jgi:plasmid stabilization system protein ParE